MCLLFLKYPLLIFAETSERYLKDHRMWQCPVPGYLTASGDERFYASSLMPVLQRFVGAETAHIIAVRAIGLGLVPYNNYKDPASLVSVLKICDKLLYGSVSQIDDTFP